MLYNTICNTSAHTNSGTQCHHGLIPGCAGLVVRRARAGARCARSDGTVGWVAFGDTRVTGDGKFAAVTAGKGTAGMGTVGASAMVGSPGRRCPLRLSIVVSETELAAAARIAGHHDPFLRCPISHVDVRRDMVNGGFEKG